MAVNEAATRRLFIDRELTVAGWDVDDPALVGLEIPVDGAGAEPWNGITDYCLYQSNGEVIAVVEAKRTSRHARVADEQVRHYVTQIEHHQSFRPFGFMTNGADIYFWDVGEGTPRLVSRFFTPEDLENLLWIRQNKQPLSEMAINSQIAGRIYQQEAIRRIADAFEQSKRRALLVMATGTGKTRTAMALIDLFHRTNQARSVLFLADRDALVDQALKDGFQTHLPNEPRDRIYTHAIDKTKRLYVATLQTIGRCFNSFSPAFFDLIIFDEAHRSIFNRLGEVMDYFDGRMIGLTATPANFIDRDTFRLFDCHNNLPTYLYSYKRAVDEEFLVNYSLYQARTRFQRQGIRGVDLSEEEQNALIDQGLDPDEIDYSGTEIEKTVSNTDTLRRQWEELWEICHKDQSGQLPGKTIIFAMTQAHAQRLQIVFEQMFPQFPELVKAITSDTERVRDGSYGDGLITQFKKNDMPRIAISVDMLDTGIDVPEVVNLVFMKPVRSQIKLWQMIGRGTRNHEACRYFDRLPEGHKSEFKVIDFWENEFDKKAEEVTAQTIPVLVRIFNTRLNILNYYLKQQSSEDCKRVVADLRAQIAQIPLDSFAVRREYPKIEEAWKDAFWRFLSPSNIEFLRLKVGPLLRYVPDVDVAAATFTSKVERLKYQILTDKLRPDTLESIIEDVQRLPDFVYENPACKSSIELCLSSRLSNASPSELSTAIEMLAPKMRFRREQQNAFLMLDLPDYIATSGYVTLSDGGEQVYVTEYRERVERRILEIVESHPSIRAIREGREVSDNQLIELERTLRDKLGAKDIQLSTDNIRKAYGLKVGSLLGFIRYLLELESLPDYEVIVKRRFGQHIAAHHYNADQLRFLSAVQSVFLQQRRLQLADLYEGPFESFGNNAVERFFTPQQVEELLALTEQLAA
ncbi:MAG TPA: DEAD/DEAH box helicase family protein [Blastocatellia bacterium]|nr:DEAD/DEAH box helicase family protein [Blastocatellia bacterium]